MLWAPLLWFHPSWRWNALTYYVVYKWLFLGAWLWRLHQRLEMILVGSRWNNTSLKPYRGFDFIIWWTSLPTRHKAQVGFEPKPYIGCPCPCLPIPMGFRWPWVQCYCSWVGIGFVHPCIQLQIGVKLLDVGNTLTKKRSMVKPTIVNDLLFVQSNQDLV